MISPWIEKNTVFRSLTDDLNGNPRLPYDHCSVIKTILNWDRFGIQVDEKKFGARVANAPTFESVLNVCGDQPRKDTPVQLPKPYFKIDKLRAVIYSDLQALVLPLIVAIVNKLHPDEAKAKAEEILERSTSIADLHQEITNLANVKD